MKKRADCPPHEMPPRETAAAFFMPALLAFFQVAVQPFSRSALDGLLIDGQINGQREHSNG
jgi:hypothetical protein